jgi:hypothetical protein
MDNRLQIVIKKINPSNQKIGCRMPLGILYIYIGFNMLIIVF